MRRRARVDGNHSEIREALEDMGASVQSLAEIGDGCPDLLVGYRGVDVKLEVKNGSKPPSARQLTPAQTRWFKKWKGEPPMVVTSPESAKEAVLWAYDYWRS